MTQLQPWRYLERQRIKAGHTMLSLSKAIGRDVSQISRYESGEYRPSPASFLLLAAELNCDIDELISTAPKAPRHRIAS